MLYTTRFPWKEFTFLSLFAIAMGFAETAIVIYLREIYYPEGFSFPLKEIAMPIYLVEVTREAATILMLIAVGWFAGKNFLTRLAAFLMAFGIWDIFYYIFLKITLNWPQTLFDWDILFLIPLPWIGPVLAPILVSVVMISIGVFIWQQAAQSKTVVIRKSDWLLVCLACITILISFLFNVPAVAKQQIPQAFHWEIFGVGLLLGGTVITMVVRRSFKTI